MTTALAKPLTVPSWMLLNETPKGAREIKVPYHTIRAKRILIINDSITSEINQEERIESKRDQPATS